LLQAIKDRVLGTVAKVVSSQILNPQTGSLAADPAMITFGTASVAAVNCML
jgi:hypothetical protein